MHQKWQKYLACNRLVEIIYLDRHGNASKRTLRLIEIQDDQLKAYCLTKRAPRIFAIDNILAVRPVVNCYAV